MNEDDAAAEIGPHRCIGLPRHTLVPWPEFEPLGFPDFAHCANLEIGR
jgi:hypothetical protein